MATPQLSDLTPNPRNPRKITKKKLQMLKESMAYYGDLSGIIQVAGGGDLLGGHQRVEAYRSDPNASVEITAKYDPPLPNGTTAEGYVTAAGSRFAYRVVAWDRDKAQGAMLAANKGAGNFDLPLVSEMMGELDASGFDMDLTLFDQQERDSLLSEGAAESGSETSEQPVEATPEPITKPGDLYVLGRHRLKCGDSGNVQDIDDMMNSSVADMVYTDPPYGMNLQQCNHEGVSTKRIYQRVIGDNVEFDPGTILGVFGDVVEMFLWGADYYRKSIPDGGSWVVWDKKTNKEGEVIKGYDGSEFELCWSKKKHTREICRVLWQGFVGLHDDGGKRFHPTQKPVAIAEWFFNRFGKEGDVVVDLYGGSGSTLLACEKTARSCQMMEIDPGYCDTIVARWEKLTGHKAKLIPAGAMAEEEKG